MYKLSVCTLLILVQLIWQSGNQICLGVGSANIDSSKQQIGLQKPEYILIPLSGQSSKLGAPGDSYLIYHNTDTSSLVNKFVYLNNVPIGKLNLFCKVKSHPAIYQFKLENTLSPKDSLKGLFNPKGKAVSPYVILSIGNTLDDRKIVESQFSLIFDHNRFRREIVTLFLAVILLVLLALIFRKSRFLILKDASDIGKTDPKGNKITNPTFSLSRTQLAFWTIVILFTYLYIWGCTGNQIHITASVLFLLGISAGTKFFGGLVDQSYKTNPQNPPSNPVFNSDGFFIDIVSDNDGFSMARFQNIAFTIVIGTYFLFEVVTHKRIPDLDANIVILMAISSTAYIAVKQGENKS